MADVIWNPWHGCTKYSEGCAHCYVYRRDESIGKDASVLTLNRDYELPVRKKRGGYSIEPGTRVYACMTSDFFLDRADAYRPRLWEMIRERDDLFFTIITKRIDRVGECLPDDWGDGYRHVTLCCTVENQRQCDLRLPLFSDLPAAHKQLICEPLLGKIDFHGQLGAWLESVTVGGESGDEARVCDYAWVTDIRRQCVASEVDFHFKQTGALFVKDGHAYRIPRKFQHQQAKKAAIDYYAAIRKDEHP